MPSRSVLRHQDGFMLVEVLVAILILSIGVFGLLAGFTDSQKLSLSSEKETSMSHIAQSEIERVEGLPYASVGLNTNSPNVTPAYVNNVNNPDFYVTTVNSTLSFEWNHTSASAEPLDLDPSNGAVAPVTSWSKGQLSGSIYDFVTSTTDPNCSPGCPASADYKRITVAVTVSGSRGPSPVYVSSVIANPDATAAQGTSNGTSGNPISSGGTTCSTVTGTTTTQAPCQAPTDSGASNVFYLHDCPTTASTCSPTTASHAVHGTAGLVGGLTCATGLSTLLGLTGTPLGCPVPDKMDTTPPTGDSSSYQFSNDINAAGYAGGRLLQPLCGIGNICGTGSTADCHGLVPWANNLVNNQNEMWATPPVSTTTALTGVGAVSLYTETQLAAPAVVTLCLELYDVPPGVGGTGSILDLFSFPPVPIGSAALVPPTNPSTGSNWPTTPSSIAFDFNFAANGATIPTGDRIGLRVWMVAETNTNIALLYDSPTYPSELQLNSSSPIQLTGS